jgi:EpsD family peptidyl-prolyl cis-trans isomerase
MAGAAALAFFHRPVIFPDGRSCQNPQVFFPEVIPMRTIPGLALGALTLALSLSLAGCGDKKEGDKAASQVVAKVNDDEITVHQLNLELSALQGVGPEQARQAAGQVLKSMVDQQLLVQQALEDKLDRDPQFQQRMEATRRKLLAQAYVEKLTANAAAPTEAEVEAYHARHPELFAERRIYRLQEISVQVTPANLESVKAQLAQTRSLNDFLAWLKARDIPARGAQSTKAAEQLPLEILPRLHALKQGQALTLNAPGALNILVVADSQTQPMSKEQARPVIERFLLNSKKREAAEASLKALREKAKVEYIGEYANAANATNAADAGKQAPAPAAADTPAAPADPAPAQPTAPDAQAIEKGVSGLK